MTRAGILVALGVAGPALGACWEPADPEAELAATLDARQARFETMLARADTLPPDTPVLRWILPDRLAEVSGLALSADGRLFAHGDETGRIVEIDYRRGLIAREWSLGPPVVLDDFEAITAVGDTLVMLTSKGRLYRFRAGEDDDGVPYGIIDTGLGDRCQFEGMTYDPLAGALILACKNVEDGGANDVVLLYRWPWGRDSTATDPLIEVRVAAADVIGDKGWSKVEPSDIAVDPRSGNYVLVASGQKGVFEVTPTGQVVASRALPPGHAQPEGLAITQDGLMLVTDEAVEGPAVLTGYRRQQ
jgi:uncharacterized protein YjiK